MSLATMIANIEKNRAVIDAQVRELGTMVPQSTPASPLRGTAEEQVSSLLEQGMLTHLHGAMATLNRLACVEEGVRKSFAVEGQSAMSNTWPGAEVIDVEAVEVVTTPPETPA